MIADIHAHTNFSNDSHDNPEDLVIKMIEEGIEVFGICDHNYGIADRRAEYLAEIGRLKQKYCDRIKILCGIEMSTFPGDFKQPPTSAFDYCLVEHLDLPGSIMQGDIVNFVRDYGCVVGIAHTDIFSFAEARGISPERYVKSIADAGIFWELNVNYDTIHSYHEHGYVKRFFSDAKQQAIVRDAGLYISVGFDGHRMEDYRADRVKSACEFLSKGGFNNAVDIIQFSKNSRFCAKKATKLNFTDQK